MQGMTLFDGYTRVRMCQANPGIDTTHIRTILSIVHVGFSTSGAIVTQLSSTTLSGEEPPQIII